MEYTLAFSSLFVYTKILFYTKNQSTLRVHKITKLVHKTNNPTHNIS